IADRVDNSVDDIVNQFGTPGNALSNLSEMRTSLDRLQTGLARGDASLGSFTSGATDLADGVHHTQSYLATASRSLDPLRDYAESNPDCHADQICSGIEKVLEPEDVAVKSANSLAAGVDNVVAGTQGAATAIAGASDSVAQLKKSLRRAQDSITHLSAAVD